MVVVIRAGAVLRRSDATKRPFPPHDHGHDSRRHCLQLSRKAHQQSQPSTQRRMALCFPLVHSGSVARLALFVLPLLPLFRLLLTLMCALHGLRFCELIQQVRFSTLLLAHLRFQLCLHNLRL